jgi:hypothetical protein
MLSPEEMAAKLAKQRDDEDAHALASLLFELRGQFKGEGSFRTEPYGSAEVRRRAAFIFQGELAQAGWDMVVKVSPYGRELGGMGLHWRFIPHETLRQEEPTGVSIHQLNMRLRQQEREIEKLKEALSVWWRFWK